MKLFAILTLLVLFQGDPFVRFTYCRDSLSGVYEKQCVELKAEGTGQSRFKPRGSAETQAALSLSASGREKFLAVIAGTRNLADRQKYESKRKVANLGHKHITLEMA